VLRTDQRTRLEGLSNTSATLPAQRPRSARMCEKLVCHGGEILTDTELLELILSFGSASRDTRPLARSLIGRFGDLGGVLTASHEALMGTPRASLGTTGAIKLAQACALHLTRAKPKGKPVLYDLDSVREYLMASMGRYKREQFRVLFLDASNQLIADEVLGHGTVNHVSVYPREVFRRALDLNATALILVHNHPAGDPSPSASDIRVTHELQRVGDVMSIIVHDHVVIGAEGLVSFRSHGLLVL
jgi:DNA repair protein RadC